MYLNNIKRIRLEYTDFRLAEKIRIKILEDGWRCVTTWTVDPVVWYDDIRREPIIGKLSHGIPIGVYK